MLLLIWYLHKCANNYGLLFNVLWELLMPVDESILIDYLSTVDTVDRWWCLLEQEAGRVMDIVRIKKIHLLIWKHAAKCTEVCNFIVTHTHTQPFYCSSGICPGPPGWAGIRKVKPGRLKPIWIYWSLYCQFACIFILLLFFTENIIMLRH